MDYRPISSNYNEYLQNKQKKMDKQREDYKIEREKVELQSMKRAPDMPPLKKTRGTYGQLGRNERWIKNRDGKNRTEIFDKLRGEVKVQNLKSHNKEFQKQEANSFAQNQATDSEMEQWFAGPNSVVIQETSGHPRNKSTPLKRNFGNQKLPASPSRGNGQNDNLPTFFGVDENIEYSD